ncbi:annulin-like isoform X2 [Varroa jacobsoni]|uniref:annulin-like isoform X2 n=1 Tax=Varroa jacobsoni TaxID=62625 RepID=UPI000BF759C1|nr:annulin-like isoform X2 [Varroa jacobsoni]
MHCCSALASAIRSLTNIPARHIVHQPAVSESDILEIQSIDARIDFNCRTHHTDRFSGSRHGILIARRGQPVQLVLQLSRRFQPDFDHVELVLTYAGTRFIYGEDGVERITVSRRVAEHATLWSARLIEVRRNTIVLDVAISVRAAVGEWRLKILTHLLNRSNLVDKIFHYDKPIFILFNPWSPDDPVYLPATRERDEYVLADTGLIYSGRKDRISELAWVFGQHEKKILEIVCFALRELANLDVRKMAEPTHVSRAISSIVNGHRGQDGIVEGNWSDKFHDQQDSRSPWEWSSSVEILQLFHKKRSIVRYGQCFVFAGVCNTLCRALGLPSRCVTNYRSAHDVHGNLVLDYIYNEDDELVSESRNDSIWSFHVWNEVWMQRDDLRGSVPGDFDGWQVIDATPQELSNGEFRVGPASVKAVRRGEIDVKYDCAFVLAEVNADVVFYRQDNRGRRKEIKRLIDDVGVNMSTKAVLSNNRVDITNNYKPPEGNSEERLVYERALRQLQPHLPRYTRSLPRPGAESDVVLEIHMPDDDALIGSTIQIRAVAKNNSFERSHTLRLLLRAISKCYTGCNERLLRQRIFHETLEPRDSLELTLEVTYADYALPVRVSEQLATILQAVSEDGADFMITEEFGLSLPPITVACDTQQKVGRPFDIGLSLRNPLPVALNNAHFTIESPGITQKTILSVKRPPAAGDYFAVSSRLTPKGFGQRSLIITFNSDKIPQISTQKSLTVLP